MNLGWGDARSGLAISAFLGATLLGSLQGSSQPVGTVAPATVVAAQDATIDEYRAHLNQLKGVVEACGEARDAKACDPALAGPDDRIPLGVERRLVRYDWLRVLMLRGKEKDSPTGKSDDSGSAIPGFTVERPPNRTTTELLKDAETRLDQDIAETRASASKLPSHAQEQNVLKKVLAQRDFRSVGEVSAKDTILEKIGNWINSFFEQLSRIGARSSWIGRLIVWGFLGAVCVGLVWGLIQLERRWRIRLVPAQDGPGPGAASARDWQLWLDDARRAAAEGRWREAVHFVYWAAISRLESKRLWPADRARTPREYLALVAEEDPRQAGLRTLTGSFERIWYGGRAAGESDYRAAEELAKLLIAGGGGSA